MSEVERYDEQGKPIYAIEGGPLKNLWKYLAIINEEKTKNDASSDVKDKFDYNEFFKRLYLSRAELDVTNSILQLLLGEADGSHINLSCVQHDNETNDGKAEIPEMSASQSVYLYKNSLLREVTNSLRTNAESLAKNRREEHEIICKILLKLRENYRWNLVRISNPEQIQVHFDYHEMVPIIGIDFSPLALFKNESNREQYNYKHHHQIGSDSLALVVRNKSGDLGLLFQQKQDHRQMTVSVNVKNSKTGKVDTFILFKPLSNEIVKYSGDQLDEWNALLQDARDRAICLNIMKLLAAEAAAIPKDHVDFDFKNLSICLNDEILFSINFTNADPVESVSNSPAEIYNSLLREYLESQGTSVNWRDLRAEFLNTRSN